MTPLEITLLILLATILAFVSGKIPFAVISSGIILALILTGVMTPAEAFGGFINTNVVMFVAMFVIGAGLTKTVLIDKAQSLVVRYKDNQRILIFCPAQRRRFGCHHQRHGNGSHYDPAAGGHCQRHRHQPQ